VLEWLHGEHNKERIDQYLSQLDPSLNVNGCVVCICEMGLDNQDVDLTYYTMIFRSIFEQKGFYPLVSHERTNLFFALVNKRDKGDWKIRLSNAIGQIKDTELIKK